VPVVSLSKGIETSSLCMMSDLLPELLGEDRHALAPSLFVSGAARCARSLVEQADGVSVGPIICS